MQKKFTNISSLSVRKIKSSCLLLVLLLTAGQLVGQSIKISYLSKKVNQDDVLAFPASASATSRLSFFIKNQGSASLQLSSPAVVSTNDQEFTIDQPAVLSIAAGDSVGFSVNYLPVKNSISETVISIASNDQANGLFKMNLKGSGNSLYGPVSTPSGTVQTDVTGEAGRFGGRTIVINAVSLSTKTDTYWGPAINSAGQLQLKVSLDGSTYTDQEVLTYNAPESDLANGKAVWRGITKIQRYDGYVFPVYIKATLVTRRPDNTIVPLIDPVSLGLSAQVGGLVKFTGLSDILSANYLIEASFSPTAGFTPYLQLYDGFPTPPGPLPGQGIGAAYSSVTNGFYWMNLSPKIAANNIFDLHEGEEKAILTQYLNVSDNEDLPAQPEKIVFVFAGTDEDFNPMSFKAGNLKLNGIVLRKSDSFTLKNIQDGKLTYAHNGEEKVYDEFQFSVSDSKGALAKDGQYSVYSFKISINPVNDAPVTSDTLVKTSFKVSYSGILTAKDEEGDTLTFELVDKPKNGNVIVGKKGNFTYTTNLHDAGKDSFTFRASDGKDTGNVSTLFIELHNTAPTAKSGSMLVQENASNGDTLSATDLEGEAITFTIIKAPAKGELSLFEDGSFDYVPNKDMFGMDYFTFKATDEGGNSSPETLFTIAIKPGLDAGDVLISDREKIRLYDPATQQDTVIFAGGNLSNVQTVYYKQLQSLFALDSESGLLKINTVDGTQSVLVPASNFNNQTGPLNLTMNKEGYMLIADGPNGVVRVDTGNGENISLYKGGDISFTSSIAVLNNGDLVVSDVGLFSGAESKILRITKAGEVSVISSGENLNVPIDIALAGQDVVFVSDAGTMAGGTDAIIKINLNDGSQEIVDAGNLNFPTGIDYQKRLKQLFIVNQKGKNLIGVDENGVASDLTLSDGLTEPFGLFVIQSLNSNPQIAKLPAFKTIYGDTSQIDLRDFVSDEWDSFDQLTIEAMSSSDSVDANLENGVLTLIYKGVGTASVGIKVTDSDGDFATKSIQVSIGKASQTITFDEIESKNEGDEDFELVASSDAALPVLFEALSSNVEIVDNTVKILGPGQATIVAKQNGNGFYNAAEDVTQTFCIIPSKPTITLTNENDVLNLASSSEEGNHWYLNDVLLEDQTLQTLVVKASGTYSVRVSIDGCTGEVSDGMDMVITSMETVENSEVKIGPVPAEDRLFVKVENMPGKVSSIEIVDLVGQSVFVSSAVKNELEINVGNLKAGSYILLIRSENSTIRRTFIKN